MLLNFKFVRIEKREEKYSQKKSVTGTNIRCIGAINRNYLKKVNQK